MSTFRDDFRSGTTMETDAAGGIGYGNWVIMSAPAPRPHLGARLGITPWPPPPATPPTGMPPLVPWPAYEGWWKRSPGHLKSAAVIPDGAPGFEAPPQWNQQAMCYWTFEPRSAPATNPFKRTQAKSAAVVLGVAALAGESAVSLAAGYMAGAYLAEITIPAEEEFGAGRSVAVKIGSAPSVSVGVPALPFFMRIELDSTTGKCVAALTSDEAGTAVIHTENEVVAKGIGSYVQPRVQASHAMAAVDTAARLDITDGRVDLSVFALYDRTVPAGNINAGPHQVGVVRL